MQSCSLALVAGDMYTPALPDRIFLNPRSRRGFRPCLYILKQILFLSPLETSMSGFSALRLIVVQALRPTCFETLNLRLNLSVPSNSLMLIVGFLELVFIAGFVFR